jgi:integrase
MALFRRGNVWWFEYRTRKVRVVKSTGFSVLERENRKKAQAVYDAVRLAHQTHVPRMAMENILSAVYQESGVARVQIPLDGIQGVYDEWMKGKGRVVSEKMDVNRRHLLERFVRWCGEKKIVDAVDVTVGVAREYVRELKAQGKSNKTVRTYCQYLGGIWRVCQQMGAKLDNPWVAACPDSDGTSVRRGAFTEEEEKRVLAEARKVGHGWYLASVIARWTGLRYGDVARLEWGAIDWEARVIRVVPSKTRKHGVEVCIPIAPALWEALEGEKAARGGEVEGFILPEHGVDYPNKVSVRFSRVLEAAGLDAKVYTFHSWRHTFRTRLAEAGVSGEIAKRLGGWTNLEMAAHYDHASHLGEMREAIRAMGNVSSC